MKVKNSENRMKYPSPQCTKPLSFLTQFLGMLVSYALVCSCSKFSTSTGLSYSKHYLNVEIIQTVSPGFCRNASPLYQHQTNIKSYLFPSLLPQHGRI